MIFTDVWVFIDAWPLCLIIEPAGCGYGLFLESTGVSMFNKPIYRTGLIITFNQCNVKIKRYE